MGFETQYRVNSKFRKANDWEVNLWVLHPPISKGLSVCWYVISKINKVCVSVCVCVCVRARAQVICVLVCVQVWISQKQILRHGFEAKWFWRKAIPKSTMRRWESETKTRDGKKQRVHKLPLWEIVLQSLWQSSKINSGICLSIFSLRGEESGIFVNYLLPLSGCPVHCWSDMI